MLSGKADLVRKVERVPQGQPEPCRNFGRFPAGTFPGCIFSSGFFLSSFQSFLGQFPDLFTGPVTENGDEPTEDTGSTESAGGFFQNYGWLYAAREVATFENISLEQVWGLPVLQYLNGLQYIKSKSAWEKEQAEAAVKPAARRV